MEVEPDLQLDEDGIDEGDDGDDLPQMSITIQNVVATVDLGYQNLNLTQIAQSVRNAEYNPTRFQAVILRIREPRSTALIFKSGKMIVTGTKKKVDNKNACEKYTAIIRKIGFPVSMGNYTVQNITATGDAGFPVRLEGFIYAHSSVSTYEPELFPGLVYRMASPKMTLLIFVSGKIVLTGAKTTEDLETAGNDIIEKLMEFRKTNLVIAHSTS